MLTISPHSLSLSRRFLIDLDKVGFSKNILSYLYQKGYDEIEVVNLNSAVFRDIRDRVSDLMGLEIIEHSEKRCVIKAVSKEIVSHKGECEFKIEED